jgi:Kef-type K+ transport system membrane component KefB
MTSNDRPQSALNLRLVLATFGLICTVVLLVLAFTFSNRALAVVSVVLLAVTITDIVAIIIRRRRRKRREPGVSHSLFE